MNLSENSIKILCLAGWHSERQTDTKEYENFLIKQGYYVNTAAIKFLKSFGGLYIDYPYGSLVSFNRRITFNPIDSNHIDIKWVKNYELKIGETLTLVGFSPSITIFILVSESGKFYGGTEDEEVLFFLGNNCGEALNEILSFGYGVRVEL